MPEVSVVIPAYNAEPTLSETLASVCAQTFSDIEVIVIDDGSTDGTAALVRGWQDPRVRVVSVPQGGVARARNTGIELSTGAFVAFIDADDMWLPAKLERQLEAIRAPGDHGMCVTAAIRVDARGAELAPIPVVQTDDYCKALLLDSMVAGCLSSGLVRRSAIERSGAFNPALSQCADWDLWLRLSRVTTFAVVPGELVLYRVHANNMSADISLLERDTFGVLDAFFSDVASTPYRRLRRRVYSNHRLICSGSYLHAGRFVDAVRCLIVGLATYPPNIGRVLARAPWRMRRTTQAPRSSTR